MAIELTELKRWLDTLGANSRVAIDEGGLALIEVGSEAYLEVGGDPATDPEYEE